MQRVNGISVPTVDTHFPDMIRRGPLVDGKGTYQLNKFEAALPFLKHKRVAIDVGAHVGLWTRVMAPHFDQVHAFEPVTEHVYCFADNVRPCDNVVLRADCIVGAESGGHAQIVRVAGNSGNAHVGTPARGAEGVALPIRALDDLLAADLAVDFVKIDVEGYELEVVRGASNTIGRCKPVMIVEQKPGNAERYGHKTGEVIHLLHSWGARTMWVKSGDYCIAWE
jgi:FkbM family methyltransferase